MKLIPYGNLDVEKLGLIDADGALRNLVDHVADVTGDVLCDGSLDEADA